MPCALLVICMFVQLTHSEHKHPQGYEINYNLKLVKSFEKKLYICGDVTHDC